MPPAPARRLRRRLRLSATAVLLLVATACSTSGDIDPVAPAGPTRAGAQDLSVAVGEDPFLPAAHLPGTARTGPSTTGIPNLGLRSGGPNPAIFETLTRVTPTFGVGPGLAEGWEEVSPTRWRFTLRSGVTFHDGTTLDAGAVVDTLETVSRRQNRPRGLEPGGTTAVDERTVEVALSSPNLRLPEQLTDPSTAIRAPGTVAGPGAQAGDTPTGTGPFRFVSYTPGRELVVEAYEDYWGGRAQLDSITFLFGPPEDASRRLATREALAVGHVPLDALTSGSGRDRSVTSPPASAVYLLLNTGGTGAWETLRDQRLRRAVGLAVDRDALSRAVWPDHGTANDTLIPPATLGTAADRVSAPARDLSAARQLLEDAGWEPGADGLRQRDGVPLELTLILARPEELGRAGAIVRDQLAEVGIGVALPEDGGDVVDRYQRVNEGTFDLFLELRAPTDANPCALCRFFSIRPGGQLTIAGTVGAGDAADARFEEAFTAPTIEGARRWAAELMAVVVENKVVAVPLTTLPHVWLLSPRVQGFVPSALSGAQQWDQVWLST